MQLLRYCLHVSCPAENEMIFPVGHLQMFAAQGVKCCCLASTKVWLLSDSHRHAIPVQQLFGQG
jgi:hypothetical protein